MKCKLVSETVEGWFKYGPSSFATTVPSIFLLKIISFYVWIFSLHACLCICLCAWCLWGAEESISSFCLVTEGSEPQASAGVFCKSSKHPSLWAVSPAPQPSCLNSTSDSGHKISLNIFPKDSHWRSLLKTWSLLLNLFFGLTSTKLD